MNKTDDIHNLDSVPHAGLFPEVTDTVLAGRSLDIPAQATHAWTQFQGDACRETTDMRDPEDGGPGRLRVDGDEVLYPIKDFRDGKWVREGAGTVHMDVEFFKPLQRRG